MGIGGWSGAMISEIKLNFLGATFDRVGNLASMALVFWALTQSVPLQEFGLFVLVYSLMSVFLAFSQFGLNEILVKEIVLREDQEARLVTSGWGLRATVTLSLIFPFWISANFVTSDSELAGQLLTPFSLILVFRTTDVIKSVYESRSQLWVLSFPQAVVQILFCIAKLMVVFQTGDIVFLAWVMCVEFAVLTVLFIVLYCSRNGALLPRDSLMDCMTDLFNQGLPLAISALAVVFYLRTDQIMIGAILGEGQLGLYAPVVMISEVWYLIPVVLVTAFFPRIMSSFDIDNARYLHGAHRLLFQITALTLGFLVVILFLAEALLATIFGDQFGDAAVVLQIYAFSALFVAHGLISSRMLIMENLYHLVWIRTAFGAVTNIGLNLILIPTYGLIGAALATSISYFLVVVFTLVDRRAFHICRIMVYSFVPVMPQSSKSS